MNKAKAKIDVEAIVKKYKGDSAKLIRELKKVIQEGQKTNDILLIGAAYYHLSIVHYDDSDWEEMFVNAIKAVTYLDKTDAYELMAKAHIALSIAYEEQENSLMSFEECDRAYQILKKHQGSTSLKIIALNNLATCYQTMRDTKTAVKMLDECIDYIQKDCPDDLENLAMIVINKANFYKVAGDIDKSNEILKTIANWIDQVEFKPLVCDYYLRLAVNAYALNDSEEGKRLTLHAIEIVPDGIYPSPLFDDFREIGHFAVIFQQNDIVVKIFNLMETFEKKCKGTLEQTLVYRFMVDYYRAINDHQKVSEYHIKLDELYEKRMEEQKGSQCKAYIKMKLADQELNKINQKMKEKERLASREPLTGLLNRSALLDITNEFIVIADKKKQKVGAIFVDIDFLKECNDTYGHTKGDEIIKLVAETCQKEETDHIRFARYGGDEFFGVTHGLTDEEVIKVAKRISSSISSKEIPNVNSPYKIVTVSVGLINVMVSENTKTIIDMVKFADKAMYHAKNNGKNAIYHLDFIGKDFSCKKITL